MDLYSRAIVGWALQRYMTFDLITEALDMAIARRDIQKGLIVHSTEAFSIAQMNTDRNF